MAKKTFLNKSIPKRPVTTPVSGNHAISWSVYLVIPVLIAASLLYYFFMNAHSLDLTKKNSPEVSSKTIYGAIPYQDGLKLAAGETNTKKAASVKATATTATPVRNCDVAFGSGALDAKAVFPIIPEELSPKGQCPPTQWDLMVVRYFSYKLLTAANYLAYILAILFTVWAGILYISGFANEQNTKKAKAIVIGAYVGLLIVILARTILYGSIQTTLDGEYNPGVTPVNTKELIK